MIFPQIGTPQVNETANAQRLDIRAAARSPATYGSDAPAVSTVSSSCTRRILDNGRVCRGPNAAMLGFVPMQLQPPQQCILGLRERPVHAARPGRMPARARRVIRILQVNAIPHAAKHSMGRAFAFIIRRYNPRKESSTETPARAAARNRSACRQRLPVYVNWPREREPSDRHREH